MAESPRPAAAPEHPPLHGGKLLFLTAAIATASFMEILDMTIVNVSVPAICGLATSLPMLVTARLIQGLVSGPMMVVAELRRFGAA